MNAGTGPRTPRERRDDDRPPLWRRDFPLTSTGEEQVTRREFARFLVLASAAFAAGTAVIAGWATVRNPPVGEPTPLVTLDDLPVGGTRLFEFPTGDNPAIPLRLGEDDLVAFSQKCTHLGCTVYHVPEEANSSAPATRGSSTNAPAR